MVPLRTNRLEPCNPRQTGRRQALLRLCSIAIGGHGRRWAWRGFSQVLATPHLPNFFCRMTRSHWARAPSPWPGWAPPLWVGLAGMPSLCVLWLAAQTLGRLVPSSSTTSTSFFLLPFTLLPPLFTTPEHPRDVFKSGSDLLAVSLLHRHFESLPGTRLASSFPSPQERGVKFFNPALLDFSHHNTT